MLDTHAFLWWINDDERLSVTVRGILEDDRNDVYLSAVSAWEIAIKAASGRLQLDADPSAFVPTELETNGFVSLQIDMLHALRVFSLPMLHRDPFDRLLVVQSQLEGLTLLTSDERIRQYTVDVVW